MQEREYLQKKITPGTNLSWGADGKTLNANVPSIEANPQDTATDTLNKLELDGTVYELAGGTEVEANPADPATDTLSSIDIDGTVYSIEGSGGGGGGTGNLNAVEMEYEDWLALPQSEREDPTIEYFLSNAPGGGGGTGDLSAYELTQNQYNNLPTTQKLDDKELYFINNNITTEEAIDVTDFVNKVESSGVMTITADSTNNTLTYTWGGASTIGANSFYPTVIPSNVTRIGYKITTGTSYTTSDNRFKIGIGVKTTYDTTTWAMPSDNNWVAIDIYNTQNTVIEGSLDLSEVDEDTYFYICGHGWNMTIEDLTIVTVNESTDSTKIMYKDVEYGNSGSSGGSSADELIQSEYDLLTSEQKNDGTIRFIKKQDESGTYTESKTLTFLNTTTPFNVGENFVSAIGTYTGDSTYTMELSVSGNQGSATRLHNGTVEFTSTDCTYENGVFTFDQNFVLYYCGTGTWDFECEYNNPSYVGDKIYYMDKEYGNGGGSSSGGNLYGTTDPTSDLGNNGDIYMKYGHRYVNTNFISSTTTIPWGSTLDVTITDMDTYDSLHIDGTCMIGGYGGQPFDEEWDVNNISDSSSSPSQVTANSDCYMYRDGDTLKFSNTVTSGTITLLEGTKADAPYIIGEYGKIEDEWVGFPDGDLITTYYARNAQISDGTNQQFITVQLDQPIEEGSDYVMVIKNTIDGTPVQKAFFNYLNFGNYYSTTVYGGSSIRNIYLQITPTTIICTDYQGSWQDIYIDVYRTVKHSSSNTPFVNYSTTEQVVGTWIDGKSIYQKTWQLASSATISSHGGVLPSEVSDYLVSVDAFVVKGLANRMTTSYVTVINGGMASVPIIVWAGTNTPYYAMSTDTWGDITVITLQYTKTTD